MTQEQGRILAGIAARLRLADELEAKRDEAEGWPTERIGIVGCEPPVDGAGCVILDDDEVDL